MSTLVCQSGDILKEKNLGNISNGPLNVFSRYFPFNFLILIYSLSLCLPLSPFNIKIKKKKKKNRLCCELALSFSITVEHNINRYLDELFEVV